MRFHSLCQVFLVVVCGVLMYATLTVQATASSVSVDAAPTIAFKKVELAEKETPLVNAAAATSTSTTTSTSTATSTTSSAISSLKSKVESESAKGRAAAFGSFYHSTKQIYQKILDLQPNCPHMTVE